jgi:flagellar motor switch protein FliN
MTKMSDGGKLSQEEIDALLGKAGFSEEADKPTLAMNQQDTETQPGIETVLTPIEQDALGEIGNISFGSAATALSTLLNQKVEITTPSVSLISRENLEEEFPVPHVSVRVEYTEGFRGSNMLLIDTRDAGVIADLMLGGDGTNPSDTIGEIQLSAVQEAMNQMMGASSTSMSTMFNKRIDISPPTIKVLDIEQHQGLDHLPDQNHFLKIRFQIKVGNLIDSNIMQILPVDFSKELVELLLNPGATSGEEELNLVEDATASVELPESLTLSDRLRSEAFEDQVGEQVKIAPPETRKKPKPEVAVQPLVFSDFNEPQQPAKEGRNIDLLLDIPLNVTVELGRTHRLIKDILALMPGTVVELDKLAGEPVDILINNQPIAKGEVVVIDENFGVRITEIMNRRERLKNINS